MKRQSESEHLPGFPPIESDADWHAQGWDNESEPITAATELSALISIRLDPESALLVARAARRAGVGRSEFVRRAAISAATSMINKQQSEAPRTDDSEPFASSI
jgi:hypothetical protein